MVASCLGADRFEALLPLLCQDHSVRILAAVQFPSDPARDSRLNAPERPTVQRPSPATRVFAAPTGMGTVPERVMAAELGQRSQPSEALSMMVSSMVRMVQAGKGQAVGSRWSAS